MAVVEYGVAMALMNTLELFGKGIVIRLVVLLLALLNFIQRRRLSRQVNGVTVEGRRRTKAGGILARVQRFIGRVAIGIDDVAMNRGADDAGISQ